MEVTRRIAMWSGPRNISTAMMRAFENRPDCAVVDEPFYAAYLATTGYEHPGGDEVIASQSLDWQVVARALTSDKLAPVYYQKHMTQHLLPNMDLGFTDQLENCFLIRDPRRIIASYARVRPSFVLEELGFEQQLALFRREADRRGDAPPVLDAALTLADPEGVLRALCDRLDLPFSNAMLSWPAGPRDSDGVWAPHWYSAVWASTGFAAPDSGAGGAGDSSGADEVRLTEAQERLGERAEEIYREMRPHALGDH